MANHRTKLLLCSSLLVLLGCKDAAEMVTAGAIKGTKDVLSGISQGTHSGRKAGASLDGATLVSSDAELAEHGSLTVTRVTSSLRGEERELTIELAMQNRDPAPLRIAGTSPLVLDKDQFAYPAGSLSEDTVPPAAKVRTTIRLTVPAHVKPAALRLWADSLPMPEPEELPLPPAAPAPQ